MIIIVFLYNKSEIINKTFTKFYYLNSSEIDKKQYIWQTPFITSNIEKVWM
jgi:hypothetical protein